MKRFYRGVVLGFVIFCLTGLSLHAQDFQWVKGGGTAEDLSSAAGVINYEGTYYMCTDPNGNVYALSIVGDEAIHADTFYRSSAYGANNNLLLTSYNCSGQMRWAKLIASSAYYCVPYGLVADSLGHIYIAGNLPPATLHIGYDSSITGDAYQQDGVVQFDTSGHFNWIRFVGSNTTATYDGVLLYGSSLCVDGNNNVHFLNSMKSGVPITPAITSNYGTYDLKYTSSGNLLSAKRLQLDSTLEVLWSAIDKQNNTLYASGYRSTLFSDSTDHCFIAAFDTARNLKWSDTLSDPVPMGDGAQGISGIAPDGDGHIYLCGTIYQYGVYKGDTIRPAPGAYSDYLAFIMKADTSGNMEWVKQCNSNSYVSFSGITLSPTHQVAATGSFLEYVNNPGSPTFVAGVGYDPLFFVVDTAGTYVKLETLHGDGYEDAGNVIISDNIGNLYIGGDVADSIPDTIITPYVSVGGNTDFFVLKYGVPCGCSSAPVAAYTYTISGTHTVSLTYTGTTTELDSVVWSYGDGHTGSGITAMHVYTGSGTFDLCATVYTGCGSNTSCHTVTVTCSSTPLAAFTDTGTTTRGFTYTGTTTGLDSVTWSYGDGHTGSGLTSLHTYSASGTYTVCVTVHTSCGNNTSCGTVTIDCSPVSAFTYTGGTSPAGFVYTGTTTGLDSVVWNYGDGGTGSGITVTHTYSASGTYSVCATVYTSCGSNAHCSEIVISCTPDAAFSESGTLTKDFTYTGTTSGVDSVTWSFGDGASASGNTAAHTYTATGTYTVCVTAHSGCGDNTHCGTLTISCITAPIASFSDSGHHTVSFVYTGTTAGLDSVIWNFGDGSTDTGIIAHHTYSASDTFRACVTVYTSCGSDSVCSNIVVHTTGVALVASTVIQVYPNPVGDELNVIGVTEATQYRLLTVTGTTIEQGILQPGRNRLSLKNCVPGVYILQMTGTAGEKNMTRVVKE